MEKTGRSTEALDRKANSRETLPLVSTITDARNSLEMQMTDPNLRDSPAGKDIATAVASLNDALAKLIQPQAGNRIETGTGLEPVPQAETATPVAESVEKETEIPEEFKKLMPSFCESGEGRELFSELLHESIEHPSSPAATTLAYLDVIKSFPKDLKKSNEVLPEQLKYAYTYFSLFAAEHYRTHGGEQNVEMKLVKWAEVVNRSFEESNVPVTIKVPHIGDTLSEATMTYLDKGSVKRIRTWGIQENNGVLLSKIQVNLGEGPVASAVEGERRISDAGDLAIPSYCRSGKGEQLYRKLNEQAEQKSPSSAAAARAYLHVMNSFSGVTAKELPVEFFYAVRDFGRLLVQNELANGVTDQDAIAKSLRDWTTDILNTDKRVNVTVPIVGGQLDLSWMAYKRGREIETIQTWGVRSEGYLKQKAEVNMD
jgi:hypothetical protein